MLWSKAEEFHLSHFIRQTVKQNHENFITIQTFSIRIKITDKNSHFFKFLNVKYNINKERTQNK